MSVKDRLITEACDFGVVYGLYLKLAPRTPPRPIVKISWEIERPSGEVETLSCVFEINLAQSKMWALGRKGNQLPLDRFDAKKICAWARRELSEYDSV